MQHIQPTARATLIRPRLALLTLAATALLAAPGAAQRDGGRELLNSERIERDFGSYGIEVIAHGDALRVSNLYSTRNGTPVTRTFAVVLYPEPDEVERAYASEHDEIVSGGSIGAVFTRNGWTVQKRHRFFGALGSTPRLERMMGGIPAQPLATHAYVLGVAKAGAEHDYATIVEIHHPEYLALEDLRRIYGDGLDPPVTLDGLRELVGALETTAERMKTPRRQAVEGASGSAPQR